jgi:uncharacterized RDD family membrane protein YckC
MTSRHDGPLGLVAGAASFPARAAANVCRDRLEDAAEAVLSAPGTLRAIDRALAGPLPEEIVRAAVRARVLERMLSELAAEGALDDLVTRALRSGEARAVADRIVASEEMRRALHDVMTSPEVRAALVHETAGLADEVLTGLRAGAARLDDRTDRRRAGADRAYAGLASRALAFAADAVVCAGLFVAVAGVAALAGWMVGGLRPQWLVDLLLAIGLAAVSATYFVLFWSTAGRTPGMHLLHLRVAVAGSPQPPSTGRCLVRLAALALAIVPLFAGFLPVLFDRRRRGVADMIAGTTVVYGAGPGKTAPAATASAPSR